MKKVFFQNNLHIQYNLLVFKKILVFTEIAAKLPKVRNNLVEQIIPKWNSIVP